MIEMERDASRPKLRGDDPKTNLSQDDFGLRGVVESMASALSAQVSIDGFVLGIEGAWGSGKSSLINFLINELVDRSPDHQVIRFEPWLIGERESLLTEFFGTFAAKIDEWGSANPEWNSTDRAKNRLKNRLARSLQVYGRRASGAATAVSAVSAIDPTLYSPITAAFLNAFSGLARLFGPKSRSLVQIKSDLVADLQALGRLSPNTRFFVVIDDLDRLEPSEAIEIIRLIRKVADFPLVVYLLCFDRSILCRQVTKQLDVDGNEFLEKVLQLIVSVPPQEPFALRRYLQKILFEAFPEEMSRTDPARPDWNSRKNSLMDFWAGRYLQTPRDVNRLVDSIIFGWPEISMRADFFDFAWLQLVKLKIPDLYSWVQTYVSETGGYRDGGMVGGAEAKKHAQTLVEISNGLKWTDEERIQSGLDSFLPGIKQFVFENENARVYDFDSETLGYFESGQRLGSPSHWRNYFAFDKPSYAIGDDEINAFRDAAAARPARAAEILRNLAFRSSGRKGFLVRVLLDRLRSIPIQSFSDAEMNGLIEVFSNTMDEFGDQRERDELGSNSIWRAAERLLQVKNPRTFLRSVENGRALNWLAYVIRRQGFALGRPPGDRDPSTKSWLSSDELDLAIEIVTRRFEALGRKIFTAPEPLQILFCWMQLGDQNKLNHFVQSVTRGNEGFLKFLNAIRGWVHSSDRGVYFPLYKHTIQYFLDADKTKNRLEKIATSKKSNPKLRDLAVELLGAWSDRDF